MSVRKKYQYFSLLTLAVLFGVFFLAGCGGGGSEDGLPGGPSDEQVRQVVKRSIGGSFLTPTCSGNLQEVANVDWGESYTEEGRKYYDSKVTYTVDCSSRNLEPQTYTRQFEFYEANGQWTARITSF